MNQTIAAVLSNREVMPETCLMWLEAPEMAAEARPGQFVMVGCDRNFLLRRPFSIHNVESDRVAILFAATGGGTRWLSQLNSGDSLDIMGPLGNGYTINPESKRRLLLVGGGIGIATLVFLARRAATQGHRVTLLMGAYSEAQLYPAAKLAPEIEFVTATETGDDGRMVTELIPEYAPGADQVFACGPAAMYRAMATRREALGLMGKSVQVSLEVRMACGYGVCYGCTIKARQGLKQVCRHGPVFEMDDILWDKFPSNI
jgi:dihydroorotate dehydrogenase electron transfer subunit